ncbi:restriction endonuclease [Pseudomonas syringae]|uniref:restriction endonuclease n=1 Tax=Pseudomonas syringae TaxID=317 RepID=UPI000A1DE570|nr:restriction endonuclease [Pseudomonas syringae]MDU8266101.1 restriction endonuclease [Pseudomonas syringae pv. actinidiae]MDU8282663.1 restriction endonuclease [Pseudomonas syringae pv. actinidiae]MDU8303590.1 restriction endonuclease [Pseudomonas syringae pv. actinidiae]OSN37490.1 Effector protein HopM1 [Pseudomonas syringae pv. actinidiae]OSN45215.1 Effector protein HopM1 [Pseudomonas syringae pv. actinidiae]
MSDMRINVSRSAEIQRASQQSEIVPVAAHPNAVAPSSNPPLMPNQARHHAAESSAAGAARLKVAVQHEKLLKEFQAEQATAPGSGAPMISARAAFLIGSSLQSLPKSEKVPFEVMAERLSPERYQLKQFHGSELQQLLGKFAQPGQAPDKAEVWQLIKGFARSVADQVEHFQLMHDATAHSFGAGGLRDRTTLAVSQKALGEYADRASKAIEDGLNESITSLDGHIADLDAALGNVEEGDNLVLEMDKQALVNAKATLVDLHAEFPKSPEAKRLNSVAAHAQMDTLVDKLNVDRNSVGGWKGVGPIVAAAVPQFIASMTHLGFVRTATSDEMKSAVPGKSSDASMLKAAVVGLVAGVAHEGVTNLVKPLIQAGLQKTGLNERMNMVPLEGIDTNSVIPDPFEFKNEDGALVKKTAQEMTEDKAFVAGERAVLNQKKVQVSSTHPLGEMIPYGAFGGGQAVRQMLHDFNQISGQTLTAKALTSGMAGAISATTQTIAQLKSNYVDPQGRKIPVFTPERKNADLGKDLAKGLDLREATVRTAFYSKAISGIQSSAVNALVPPLATMPKGEPGRLSAGNILRNMALAATGSVSYLSTLYANQSITAEAKALKDAGMGGTTPMLARTETVLNNIRHPDRASLPHTFQPGTLGGVPRAVESAYHMGRGALQLPTQMAVDTVRVVEEGVLNAPSAVRNAFKSEKPAVEGDELVAMEEGRRR